MKLTIYRRFSIKNVHLRLIGDLVGTHCEFQFPHPPMNSLAKYRERVREREKENEKARGEGERQRDARFRNFLINPEL